MSDIDIDDLEAPASLLTVAMILAIVYVSIIWIPTVIVMCIVIKCRRHCCLRWLFLVTLFLEFCISVTCMILALIASGEYDKRAKTLKELDDAVDGCMDAYSQIPDHVIDDQLDEPIKEGKAAAQTLATFATLVVVKIIAIAFLACRIKCKGKKKRF